MKKDLELIINNLYKTNGFYPSFEVISNVLKPFNFSKEELDKINNNYKEILKNIILDKENLKKIILNIKIDKMVYPSFSIIKNIFSKIDFIDENSYKIIFENYKDIILQIINEENFLVNETNFFKKYKGFYVSPNEFIKLVMDIEFLTDEFKEELKNKYKTLLLSYISNKENINKILLYILNKIGHYPTSEEFEQEISIKEILKLVNLEQKEKIKLFVEMNFSDFILKGDNYKKIVKKVFEEKGKFALTKNLEKIDEWKKYVSSLKTEIKDKFDEKVLSYMIDFIGTIKNVNKGRKLFYNYIKDIPNKVITFAKLHYKGDFNNPDYEKFGKDIGEGIRNIENDLMKNQEGGKYSFGVGKTSEAFWKFRHTFLPGIDKF